MARLGLNATASDTQRLAVQSRSVLFSHDTGGDTQVQVNRQGAGSTGTLVYSTGWSGRAETGLAGSDDYSIKVSTDGAAWRDAMVAEAATGRAVFPGGLAALPRPALALGMHMSSPGVMQAAEFVAAAGRFYTAPFIPPSRRLFESVAIRVTIAAAGLARFGLYADTGDCRPGMLIADLGTLDTGVTGLRTVAMALTLEAKPVLDRRAVPGGAAHLRPAGQRARADRFVCLGGRGVRGRAVAGAELGRRAAGR